MPVAALIVVGPGIKVKPIKGDPLGADRNCAEEWTNVAVEAIFVHTEIRRRVAQPDKARHERGGIVPALRPSGRQDRLGGWHALDDLIEPVVPAVQGRVVTQ